MKVLTIFGTRPEIIRLSRIIPLLDKKTHHVLVHTGQNFDRRLNDLFFQELSVRKPDYQLHTKSQTYATQISKILTKLEAIISTEKPDKILILGDTNSGLSAIVAKRMGVPVYHMEAGNRCFDDRVPEEMNRKIIDNCSYKLLPYTHNSQAFLLQEGFSPEKIIVTGNPILEVMEFYKPQISSSKKMESLKLTSKKYILATIHRAENVDDPNSLESIFSAFNQIVSKTNLPIIVSLHPRTKQKLATLNLKLSNQIRFSPPFGFFDFIKLEQEAKLVLTDSGTVQEECCLLHVPNVTVRRTTERPETLECGSNVLSGTNQADIVGLSLATINKATNWTPPAEYLEREVSHKVLDILLK